MTAAPLLLVVLGLRAAAALSTEVVGGVLHAGGRPFFVRGVYAAEVMQDKPASKPSDLHAKYDNLRLIKEAGYNTVLSYAYGASRPASQMKRFLDAAQAHGLSVIVSVRIYASCSGKSCRRLPGADEFVQKAVVQNKDHPAVLMWYINDEQGPSELLVQRYRNISRWDGTHAVLQVAGNWQCWNASECSDNLAAYRASTDVLGIDPYVWTNHSNTHNLSKIDPRGLTTIDLVGNFRSLTSRFGRSAATTASAGGRNRWSNLCVTQIHDPRNYHGGALSEPPFAAKRAFAFAAVTCGCQGLLHYSWQDMFRSVVTPTNATIERRLQELRQLGTELKSLEPFLMAPAAEGLNLEPTLPGHSTLGTLRSVRGQGARLILVNGNDRSQGVHFNVSLENGIPGNCNMTVWIEPWEVQVLDVTAICNMTVWMEPWEPPPPSRQQQQLQHEYENMLARSCRSVVRAAPTLPAQESAAFMQAYRNYSGAPASNESVVLSAAASVLLAPGVQSFLSQPDSFVPSGLDADMVQCAVLNASTPLGLAQFAVQGDVELGLVTRLLGDAVLMRDMLVAGGASGGKYGQAMYIYDRLVNASAVLRSALATSAPAPINCSIIYNDTCIHNPWGRLDGFPRNGVANVTLCCNLCQATANCVAWSYYGSTCNAFHSESGKAKISQGTCVSGGTLPLPPPPPPPPRPEPPKEPEHPWDDRTQRNVLLRLALGTALEHAVPMKHMNDPSVIDPVQRYLHYERAYLAGALDPAFEVLTVFECRQVTNSPALDQELAWLRTTMGNYRPDHIAVPDDPPWRYESVVHTDVQYHDPQWLTPPPHDYTQIPAAGGECGPRAWFGRFARRAFGMPVWGVKQQGHAAMSSWSLRGWSTLLGAGWDHVWWDGWGGPDFNLETQCREYRAPFQQVLRGQWLAHALGEATVDRAWTPRLPGKAYGTGGVWNALMLYLKKITVATYGTPPPRQFAKALVETKVERLLARWSQKYTPEPIRTRADGAIAIPAARGTMGRNAVVMPSVEAGWQLLHEGVWKGNQAESSFEYQVYAAADQKVFLTANFSTWHVNQDLYVVSANLSQVPQKVPIYYTVGYWNVTQPVSLQLVAGTNVLQFTRNSTRGIAIKEFLLTPSRG